MDSLKRLTPFIAVSAQLQPADMGALAAAGFHSVINNRPDAEGEGQPSSAEMAVAARASGLDYHFLPVRSGQITDAEVAAFSPECVKTLSYLGCLSPALLGEAIAQAFATISTDNAPEHL